MSKPRFPADEMRWAQEVEDRLKQLERTITQEAWKTVGPGATDAVPFQNGWLAYGSGYNPPGFMLDANGFVWLRGMLKSGTMSQPAFTLPPGYRPEFAQLFGTVSNSLIGRVDVNTNGAVIPALGSNSWITLDGLAFRAYQ